MKGKNHMAILLIATIALTILAFIISISNILMLKSCGKKSLYKGNTHEDS